jgi:hypothetical protein
VVESNHESPDSGFDGAVSETVMFVIVDALIAQTLLAAS